MARQSHAGGMPTFDQLMNPTLKVLRQLGGSASIQELVDHVVADLALPQGIAEAPHGDGRVTEVAYRNAWARTYLKAAGLLSNSERGVWALTAKGKETETVDPVAVVKEVRQRHRAAKEAAVPGRPEPMSPEADGDRLGWKAQLIQVLLKLSPAAFERLCQRILREAGFIEVDVTGRSGDGGVDGYGTIRIGGMISFNVLFQAKRYRGNIGPEVVRDFRGAMVGRADKGLIITTGGFTREARREATRDGAPPIDLLDGDLLADKLKELKLGVGVAMVESVTVDRDWFRSV